MRPPRYSINVTLDGCVDHREPVAVAELPRGDLEAAVRELKADPGEYLLTGGVALPITLAELGLIDEYEFVILPLLAGRGPCLLAGLPQQLELALTGGEELGSGVVVMRYVPTR